MKFKEYSLTVKFLKPLFKEFEVISYALISSFLKESFFKRMIHFWLIRKSIESILNFSFIHVESAKWEIFFLEVKSNNIGFSDKFSNTDSI